MSQMTRQTTAYPIFCSMKHLMKRLGLFLFPPGWDASTLQGYVTPALNLPVPNLYTWMEKGTVRVKCLAQEGNMPCQG